ncbi:VOC family protein [Hyphobacterium sp.]|uniref:VOC family protein n=1 Tax=Hyphobacterium sp. TaxID=2004662 RepID=UPI003B519795
MPRILHAKPVLPSLDVTASLAFWKDTFGCETWIYEGGEFGGAQRDAIELYYFYTDRKEVCDWTSCRLDVDDVDAFYQMAKAGDCIHPNGDIETKPWGYREFAALDPFGVLATFGQNLERA